MYNLGRFVGAAALAFSAAALSACYAPPYPPVADYSVPTPLSAGVSIAPVAPPPVIAETPPAAPSAFAVWQPGHWAWNGVRYVWSAGHYVQRPSPTASWIPGYWQAGPTGWTWIGGYWS